ncbi:MAG TPA: RNA-guided pseudouridylation complex pseudouridine synthase subunit Cbf5 [Candidatus Nanoarchaeia archaeon]|nr:RNA-guided pseudouridylation complex pseudouridine synthase subunit Cbf5 [Candidatus Nanoarchaeia archaeon]
MVNTKEIKEKKSIKELLEFGIINIDKPSGPTSFDVSDFVRKTLGLRKTSHFGTLDPKVTGVLPIAMNRACKLTGFFLGEDKEYVGIMRIHEPVSDEELEKIIKNFTGKIKQIPPVRSRVKRQEREREVKNFEILEKDGQDILFRAEVQGGTYIRKLIHDLGIALGVGAHMLELRRIRAGIFMEEKSVDLYELEKAVNEYKKDNGDSLKNLILPGEVVSQIFPVVQVNEESAPRILRGQPIYEKDLINDVDMEKGIRISVFSSDRFIGVFRIVNEDKIFAKSEFVLQPLS